MKVAILSDIHGNLPAWQAVWADVAMWQPERVIINGDVVNRGPQSAACWQVVARGQKEDGWLVVQGNHERYVAEQAQQDDGNGRITLLSQWTYRQMPKAASTLAHLPWSVSLFAPDGSELRACHATMHSQEAAIYPDTPAKVIRSQMTPLPALLATAHTHIPFIRTVGDTLLVNSGSVGAPVDGDTRASYGRVWWQNGRWHAMIRRVSYDRAATEQQFRMSGFLTETTPVAWLVFHEWRLARQLVVPWRKAYEADIAAGVIDEETAVIRFLTRYKLTRF
ncbi:MAG: metallophosphoesterase [Chloroflexi bacterium]|nr:MAG: metallophosphoesterase [Chloroflexota bacterium]